MSDFDVDLVEARLRRVRVEASSRRTNLDRVLDALRAGPKTAREVADATRFNDELTGSVLSTLRKRGRAVRLVRMREEWVRNGAGRRRAGIALYALPTVKEPFLPYTPQIRRSRAVILAAPSATGAHTRKKSGSGQIAGPCLYRQFKWTVDRIS
jgi:hypothetical protein